MNKYICKYIIYVNRQMNIFHLKDFFKDSLNIVADLKLFVKILNRCPF